MVRVTLDQSLMTEFVQISPGIIPLRHVKMWQLGHAKFNLHIDSGLRSSACFRSPAPHMETVRASPPRISHNTVRPHNACGFHRTTFSLSADRVKYHAALHPPHRYSARRWSPPVQYPVSWLIRISPVLTVFWSGIP